MRHVFQVMNDTDAVLVTMSESKCYQKAIEQNDPWIVAMVLDSYPHREKVWEDIELFKKENNV